MAANSFPQWAAIIGLRNRIVHEYMNLDINRVLELVDSREHAMVVDFLLTPPDLDQS